MDKNQQPSYKINHLISANKLKAYIRIELLSKTEEVEISCDEILEYLKEQEITYGILENNISEFCKNKEYSKELIAASGKEPVNGKDAR